MEYGRSLRRCFNRDIVECKVTLSESGILYQDRFNRDIVECKDTQQNAGDRSDPCFNRDIVECKVRTSITYSILSAVLIET